MIIKIVLCSTWVLTMINTIRIGKLEIKTDAIITVIKLAKEEKEKEKRE